MVLSQFCLGDLLRDYQVFGAKVLVDVSLAVAGCASDFFATGNRFENFVTLGADLILDGSSFLFEVLSL